MARDSELLKTQSTVIIRVHGERSKALMTWSIVMLRVDVDRFRIADDSEHCEAQN